MSTWKTSGLEIVPVPTDLGVHKRPRGANEPPAYGVAEAPAYLLEGGPDSLTERLSRMGWQVCRRSPVHVPDRPSVRKDWPPHKYEIHSLCLDISNLVEAALRAGNIPLVLGGDHSVAIGSVAGVTRFMAQRSERIGIIWMDAHPDMNTPDTSPTENIHGMPLACCVELGAEDADSLSELDGLASLVCPKVKGQNVCLVGVRDVDQGSNGERGENDVIETSGVEQREIRRSTTVDEAKAAMADAVTIATRDTAGFHLSFDIDFLDPEFAPAAGTPINDGATVASAQAALEIARESGKLLSVDLVEIHPRKQGSEVTRRLAIQFLEHLLRR
jgi:arginase